MSLTCIYKTFDGWRRTILEAEMDSIKAQKVDMICFTGDLQNMRPQEVERLQNTIRAAMMGIASPSSATTTTPNM